MFNKVLEILADFSEIEKSEIKEEHSLLYDLGLSSLDLVEIIVKFEEEFDIQIDDEIVAEFHTVSDIMNYLNKE